MSEIFYSQEIELNIIGCLIVWNQELRHRISEINDDDFSIRETRELFKTIKTMCAAVNEPFDLAILAANITEDLKPAMVTAYQSVSTSVYFDSYLMRLKELSQARRLKQRVTDLSVGQKVVTLEDLEEIIEKERQNVYIRSYIEKSRAGLHDFINNVGAPKERITFGFPVLDKTLGGLRVPSVMMLGAYPSVGKTAFALNLAVRQKKPVVIFSLEMSTEMIYERLISASLKMDYNLFSTQAFTEQQQREVAAEAKKLMDRAIYVFDDIYDVEGHSAVIANIKPALVVVDYIQKVKTSRRADSRRTEIEYISGLYKQIAQHNHCAILLLSQLSRIDRNNPTMASLKESGALEADGDYVGILHRPYVLDKDNGDVRPEQAYIQIDKNKFGHTGKVNLHFEGKYQQFYELDKGAFTLPKDFFKEDLPADVELPFGR